MPSFAVTCADRQTGREYRILTQAPDKAAAARTAAEDGHLAGEVVQVADHVDDPGTVVSELEQLRAEVVGLREDMRAALQIKRIHGGLQYRVMWGMILFVPVGFLLFGGLWFVMQIVNEVIANRQ
jgi:hypothetical protein